MKNNKSLHLFLLGSGLMIGSYGIDFLFSLSKNVYLDLILLLIALIVIIGVVIEWISLRKKSC